jgi:diacylglycerol kinase family enzyme
VSGIGVLTNVNSTRNRKGAFDREVMAGILEARGVNPVAVRDTASVDQVAPALREFKEMGCEIVCVSGGDGTQHHVANALQSVYGPTGPFPVLVPLKGGAMNMLARNLGVSGTPAESLVRVAEIERASATAGIPVPVRDVSALHVSCQAIGSSVVGFVHATGIAFKLLVQYYKAGKPGFRSAFNTVTSTLTGFVLGTHQAKSAFERSPATITMDGKPLPMETMFIASASAIPGLVLWFKPFRSHDLPPPGEGFYFMANDMEDWDIVRNFRALSVGQHAPHDKVVNETAACVTIHSPCGYTVDGEVFAPDTPAEVTISRGPAFRFLAL